MGISSNISQRTPTRHCKEFELNLLFHFAVKKEVEASNSHLRDAREWAVRDRQGGQTLRLSMNEMQITGENTVSLIEVSISICDQFGWL
jgi:hypothetical protein